MDIPLFIFLKGFYLSDKWIFFLKSNWIEGGVESSF